MRDNRNKDSNHHHPFSLTIKIINTVCLNNLFLFMRLKIPQKREEKAGVALGGKYDSIRADFKNKILNSTAS